MVLDPGSPTCRILFNSRDSQNRSEVWEGDFQLESKLVGSRYLKKIISTSDFPLYAKDGISLGGKYTDGKSQKILFMGWQVPESGHWMGELGAFELSTSKNFKIDSKALIEIGEEEPISISYGDSIQIDQEIHLWYGSTKVWDFGNGEMLHSIKVRTKSGDLWSTPKIAVNPIIGFAQAFSKPSILRINEKLFLAFSYRGNRTKYRIGFAEIDEKSGIAKSVRWGDFLPSQDPWENEMVEYPFLFSWKENVCMLYNGNGFGKTGFGLAVLDVEF